MKKFSISLVLILALFIIINCSKVNDNICVFRGNLERTGVYNTNGPKELPSIKWKFKTGGSDSSPVVCNGVVYIGGDGYFYAIDNKTGKEKWKFEVDYVETSPAITEGVVYFGAGHYLYALEINSGREKWRFKTKADVESSPVVFDGIVYFGEDDKYLYAVDINTGQEKWKFNTKYGLDSSPAISDGVIYFGSQNNYLYAVDAKTGQEKWKFKNYKWIESSPAVKDSLVYFGGRDNCLYAINVKTGQEIWKFKLGENAGSLEVLSAIAAIRRAYRVYFQTFGTTKGYSIEDALGDAKLGNAIEKNWEFEIIGNPPYKYLASSTAKFPAGEGKQVWYDVYDAKYHGYGISSSEYSVVSSPVLSNKLLFCCDYKYLYAIDPKAGQEKWKFELEGTCSSPAIADGVIYFSCGDYLYALK